MKNQLQKETMVEDVNISKDMAATREINAT